MRALGIVTALIAGLAGANAAAAASAMPPTVPPGITLVEVMRELTLSVPDYLWTRPGDGEGRTLFYAEADPPGVSTCVADCAAEFPPLRAPAGAKPLGDWAPLRRADGALQWAYQSRPLYVWSKETEPGEVAYNVGLTETAQSKFGEGAKRAGDLMPPEGWQVVRFTPEETLPLPDGIDVALLSAAHGVALTDSEGLVLYTFDGDVKRDNQGCGAAGCARTWVPVAAPEIALAVGDFSTVTRGDGSSQWTYRKKPLYRYSGDKLPGDVLGGAVDRRFKVAALTTTFRPARVGIKTLDGYGDILTVDGMTLYGGYVFQKRWGGRSLRDGFKMSYFRGKRLADRACVTEQCSAVWKPFLAPKEAAANGFWEVIVRGDGRRQWAYKGFALYTNVEDRAAGDIIGHATYDYAKVGGDESDMKRIAYLEELGGDRIYGGAGIYWSVVRP